MKKEKEKKGKNKVLKILFRNIKLSLGAMFRRYPKTRWQVPVYVVLKVGIRFFGSLIPAIVIAAVTSDDISRFVVTVLLVLFVQKFLGWTLDYANVEPQKQQKFIQKGASAFVWCGISGLPVVFLFSGRKCGGILRI